MSQKAVENEITPIERQGKEYDRVLNNCQSEIVKLAGDNLVETMDRWLFYARECDGLEIRAETEDVVIVEGDRVSDLITDVKRVYQCCGLDITLVMQSVYTDFVKEEPEGSVFVILK